MLRAGRGRTRLVLISFALVAPLVFGGCDEELCGASTENPLAGLVVGFLCLGYPDSDGQRLDQPRADFTVTPSEIPSGGTVTLDATASRASLGHELRTLIWDVDGRYTLGARGRGFDFEHKFRLGAKAGAVQLFRRDPAIVRPPEEIIDNGTSETRIIALQVFDETGSATTLRRVTITGDLEQSGPGPLAASFSFTPTRPLVGQNVLLDASASRGAATFSWDLDGDGSFETGPLNGPEVSRFFTTSGIHVVRLRVADAMGRTAEQPREIFVAPLGSGSSSAVAGAAGRGAGAPVSARLARVRFPSDLGTPRRAGRARVFGPLTARGRLIAARDGVGELGRFRRSAWVARLRLVALAAGAIVPAARRGPGQVPAGPRRGVPAHPDEEPREPRARRPHHGDRRHGLGERAPRRRPLPVPLRGPHATPRRPAQPAHRERAPAAARLCRSVTTDLAPALGIAAALVGVADTFPYVRDTLPRQHAASPA